MVYLSNAFVVAIKQMNTIHDTVESVLKSTNTCCNFGILRYSKACPKRLLKKSTKSGFQDRLSLNAGQKYCRMLQGEHSAILSTFIKLPFSIKIFVLYIFEWALKKGFTVVHSNPA